MCLCATIILSFGAFVCDMDSSVPCLCVCVCVSTTSAFSCGSFYIHVKFQLYIIERQRQRATVKGSDVHKHKPDEFYNTLQRFTVFYSAQTDTHGCPGICWLTVP